MDDKMKIHLDLRQKIIGELDDGSDEYDNLIVQMERLVGKGLLKRKKTLQDKFDALETRGFLKPGCYETLKKILTDSKNNLLLDFVVEAEAAILQLEAAEPGKGHKRPHEENGAVPDVKRSVPDVLYDRTASVQDVQSTSDQSDPLNCDEYPISPNQHGYLLILNSTENRSGTQYDVDALTKFFRNELKFEVDDPRSLEAQDFDKEQLQRSLNEIKFKLSQENARKKFYCFLCIVLSHGDQKGIRTRGGGFISVEEIRKMFNNNQIPTFAGRPKLFFIQACQGLTTQDGVEFNDEEDDATALEDDSDALVRLPSDADTLIAFSTTPGWKSFRRTQGPRKGSWFIQECINVFRTHRESHVEDMLIKVKHNVARNWETSSGGKQMPCVWSTLTKKLVFKFYFNGGRK